MPPKISESRPSPETIQQLEAETAHAARRIVATYAEDQLDGAILMSMLGVEPEGLVFSRVAEEFDVEPDGTPKKAAKKTTKKSTKKATKKSTKKTAKKTAKKTTKKSTKKATKKSTKKATKKTTKKSS